MQDRFYEVSDQFFYNIIFLCNRFGFRTSRQLFRRMGILTNGCIGERVNRRIDVSANEYIGEITLNTNI